MSNSLYSATGEYLGWQDDNGWMYGNDTDRGGTCEVASTTGAGVRMQVGEGWKDASDVI